jgi:hypothetical protein
MPKDKVSITLEIEKIGRGLEEVKGEIQALGKQVKADGAKITAETKRLSAGFSGIGKSIRGLKTLLPAGLAGLLGIAGLTKIVRGIVETAASFEKLQFQLRAVSKSIAEADSEFKAIREFAARTPFMTENVTQAFIQLKAVGLAPTRREMEIFGNAAFSMGRDITDVAQSIISLDTEVLRRLGIQLDRTGKKAVIMSGDIRIEVENDLNAIRQAVIDVWEKRFPGTMKKAEQTTTGLVALMQSEWAEFKNQLGTFVIPEIKNLVGWLTTAIAKAREWAGEFVEETSFKKRIEAARLEIQRLRNELEKGIAVLGPEGIEVFSPVSAKRAEEIKTRIAELNAEIRMYTQHLERAADVATKLEAAEKDRTSASKEGAETEAYWAEVRLKAAIKEQEALEAWLGELDPLIAKHGELKEAIDETAEAAKWAADVRLKAAIEEQEALDEWLGELDALKAKHGELTEETKKTVGEIGGLWEDFQSDLQWSLEAGFFDLFKGEMDDIGDYFRQFCDSLLRSFARAVAKMITEWLIFKATIIRSHEGGGGGLWGWTSSLLSGIFGGGGGGGGYMMNWGYMQHGGLINERTFAISESGRANILGEAGPEAVILLNRLSTRQEITTNIWLVDDRAKAPTPSKDDIILVVSEDIQRGGPVRKTIKRFT